MLPPQYATPCFIWRVGDKKSYGGTTLNILTDKETEYRISFTGWLSNSEQPDKVGIIRVKIANMTGEYDDNKLLYIGETL